MTITVTFECGGCFAKAEGTRWLSNRFHGFSGRDYGFGRYVEDKASDVTPPGWIAFDPYTQATYCPSCWAEINGDDHE